jgi:uncharacterized membrane protein YfcA
MELFAAKIFVGFVVGTLIGMSGVGGGVLLLPVLIFGLRLWRLVPMRCSTFSRKYPLACFT